MHIHLHMQVHMQRQAGHQPKLRKRRFTEYMQAEDTQQSGPGARLADSAEHWKVVLAIRRFGLGLVENEREGRLRLRLKE